VALALGRAETREGLDRIRSQLGSKTWNELSAKVPEAADLARFLDPNDVYVHAETEWPDLGPELAPALAKRLGGLLRHDLPTLAARSLGGPDVALTPEVWQGRLDTCRQQGLDILMGRIGIPWIVEETPGATLALIPMSCRGTTMQDGDESRLNFQLYALREGTGPWRFGDSLSASLTDHLQTRFPDAFARLPGPITFMRFESGRVSVQKRMGDQVVWAVERESPAGSPVIPG